MAMIPTQSKYPDRAGYLGLDTDRNVLSVMSDGKMKSTSTPDGWINVKDFGAKGDGVTDDTEAFNTVINFATQGSLIYIPHGTYILNNTLIIDKHYITLLGQNKNTTLHFMGCDGIVLKSSFIFIEKLTIKGDNERYGTGTPNTQGIVFDSSYISTGNILDKLYIKSFGDSGISINAGINIKISNINFIDNGLNTSSSEAGASLKLYGKNNYITTTIIENIYAQRGGKNGFYIRTSRNVMLKNFIVEYHQQVGQTLYGIRITFDNVWGEGNNVNKIYNHDTYYTSINPRDISYVDTYYDVAFDNRFKTLIDSLSIQTGSLTTMYKVIFNNLPTTDPHISGQVWNNNGTLQISAG